MDKAMNKVLVKEILFVESRREHVKFYPENSRSLVAKQSISSLEKLLSPHRFIRAHRSYIATIEKINSFTPAKDQSTKPSAFNFSKIITAPGARFVSDK